MQNLQTVYGKYLKGMPSGSGAKQSARGAHLARTLQFLKRHMRQRPSRSNMSQEQVIFLYLQISFPVFIVSVYQPQL